LNTLNITVKLDLLFTLRTVPSFVTVHKSVLRISDIRVSQGICPLIQQYFCSVKDYVEKADLSKGYQSPKRNLGVTTHFPQIIALKFGKKLPYILCILTLFLELWLLNYLKNARLPLLRSTFSP